MDCGLSRPLFAQAMIFESRNRFKPASMKAEFRAQRLDLGRLDELRMADHNAIQRPFKLFLPERQEFDQNRKIRRDIIVLPDIGLQQAGMIWQMIKNLRRCKPISGELLDKIRRWLVRLDPCVCGHSFNLRGNARRRTSSYRSRARKTTDGA